MIRETIEENRFYLVYQPIVSMNADREARYEVLLRVIDEAAIRNITKFAQSINIPCIAERVDEASSLVILWQYNVDYIQGNFVRESRKLLDYDFDDEISASNPMAEV